MTAVPVAAVAAASVAAFVLSSTWYAVLGSRVAALRGVGGDDDPATAATAAESTPPSWKILLELMRSATVAAVLGIALGAMEISGVAAALPVAAAAWVAFPVVLLTGSVIWEDVPWQLAGIHAGDWLLKLLLIAAIVAAWPW